MKDETLGAVIIIVIAALMLTAGILVGSLVFAGQRPTARPYQLLGIYKPKGFAIVFDASTGTVATTPLPSDLLESPRS